MVNRRASHAGSWYDSNRTKLASQLDGWLQKAQFKHEAKALIVPHAGYYYSGSTAAWSFKQIKPAKVDRVFILGPSHHVYLPDCALPVVDKYETPLGDLMLDKHVIEELKATGAFKEMSADVDEDEHSIEMQLPYLAHVFQGHLDRVTFVPIMVGSLNATKEESYAALLNKYINDEATIFVVSSDFCHWGKRFKYTYLDPNYEQIFESIEAVDRDGMALIEKKDLAGFHAYLSRTRNTICGRNPICLILAAIAHAEAKGQISSKVKFLHYAQSGQVTSSSDSSVSYASAVCYL